MDEKTLEKLKEQIDFNNVAFTIYALLKGDFTTNTSKIAKVLSHRIVDFDVIYNAIRILCDNNCITGFNESGEGYETYKPHTNFEQLRNPLALEEMLKKGSEYNEQ